MIEEKSLTEWRRDIQSNRKNFTGFYEHFMGASISSYPRFMRALKLYGDWPLFEAIIAASNQTLTGDPLNYVLKVAHSMWKEAQLVQDAQQIHDAEIKEAMDTSLKQNKELEKKLKKIRR